jgi:hypothetical protein
MTLFKDVNGKLSIKRVMGTVAFVYTMVMPFVGQVGIVVPFLTFVGACFGLSVAERRQDGGK